MLKGAIGVESEPGIGSKFYFNIPFCPVNREGHKDGHNQIKDLDNIYYGNKKIIVVEDDFASYLFLEELLEPTGVQLYHAENGEEAIALFEKYPEADCF
ncbi:MAG: hypothetical protein HC896_02440 [Bacteroidales bacterium]|nr:hypothetical protein [Bacteroidales bacterium]